MDIQVAGSALKFPIFMDYQSTTMVDPRVMEVMEPFFKTFCNPHSRTHSFGWRAEEYLEVARGHIANVIGAESKDIIFTSGATESNNLAIKGVANFYRKSKNHIVTVSTEHKCVLDTCRHMQQQGFNVTYLPVKPNGIIDLELLEESITENTVLVSIMAANNEIGVIQPMEEIGMICKEKNVFLHTDAAQAFGKIPLDVNKMNISLMSISAHKIYGPMGVGALYVRRKPRVRLEPIINGGGQERGLRSGTLPTALIVGFGEAARISMLEMEEEGKRLTQLRDMFYFTLKEELSDIILNGDLESRLPGNLNISFPYVEGESIIMAIKELAVSSGSACTSASLEPSYVLRAIGATDDIAHSSVRFGIGRFTTREEIEFARELVVKKIKKLRELSPLWEMVQDGIDINSINWNNH